ncbi:hypothetical protein TRICI_001647 [Trichomonascus ciferrii]|uniref:Protein SWT21 n=1 Tax=Trichomonascus ciferrii TaxID=44093 RepID=A0A642V7Z4_9ASCO|nr:hypothetical protein TRICI_001647 [Trichomonascus ciferrii]
MGVQGRSQKDLRCAFCWPDVLLYRDQFQEEPSLSPTNRPIQKISTELGVRDFLSPGLRAADPGVWGRAPKKQFSRCLWVTPDLMMLGGFADTMVGRLIADTGDIYNQADYGKLELTDGYPLTNGREKRGFKPMFKTLYWTPDGSSLISVNEDNAIRLFIVPPDLLEGDKKTLMPYTRRFNPTPILSSAVYPGFSLQDPATCGLVISTRNVPVKLYNALSSDSWSDASFPIFNANTESYQPAYAMAFDSSDNTLVCGSDRLTALFDTNRPGDDAYMALKMPGKCSAVTTYNSMVAVGTFEGYTRLYDGASGELVLSQKADKGVMQLIMTGGDLVYRVNRRSDHIDVLDSRMGLRKVAQLDGFQGNTNQRIHVEHGFRGELYTGGIDGNVVYWPNANQGVDASSKLLFSPHSNTVSSVALNPLDLGVMGTCSGDRDNQAPDYSLKIWNNLDSED